MKKLLKIYKKNLAYLQKYKPTLYTQIIKLEKSIESKPRYFLDRTENCFNIFDTQEQKYLLPKDTIYDAKYKTFQLDNSTKQSICLLETKKIDFIKTFDYDIDSYDFINQYINQINFNNIKLKKFKFIFFGILLGEDIKHIIKKLHISSILFCETNIELFRLSLFIVPYFKISKKHKLYFAIGDKSLDSFEKFYYNNYQQNHFLKYHMVSNQHTFNAILKYISLNNPLMYTFSEILGAYKRGFSYIKQQYNILKISPYLKNKQLLFLGAGPSVEIEIDFIKQNKNKLYIIATGGVLILLQKYNIKPDLIISVDGSTKIETQFKDIKKSFLKNIPFICSFSTHKNTLKYIDKKNTYFIQTSTIFFKHIKNFTGHSVGDIGLDIILSLKPKTIYLLGFDLAIVSKIAHISTHKEDFSKGAYRSKIVVDGNFNNKVETLDIFLQMKINFENIIQKYNKINIYNLSHGLHIDGTISKRAKDITIITNKHTNILFKKVKKVNFTKNKKFIQNILKKYDFLISPYNILLKSQKKYNTIKQVQTHHIKNYYKKIEKFR